MTLIARLVLLLPLTRPTGNRLLLLLLLLLCHWRLSLRRRARLLRSTLLLLLACLLLTCLLPLLLPLLLLHMIGINLAHLVELILELADPAQKDSPVLLCHAVEHRLVVADLNGRPQVSLDPHHLMR